MDLGVVLVISAIALTVASITMVIDRRKRALREQRELYRAVIELATTVERTAQIVADGNQPPPEAARVARSMHEGSPAFAHLLLAEWFGPLDGTHKSNLDPSWTYFDGHGTEGQRVFAAARKPQRLRPMPSNRPSKSAGAASIEELWERTSRVPALV